MSGGALVDVAGLACGHRPGRPVLTGVNLAVAPGGTVALLGPSGSGKTTLLRTLLGVLPPLDGSMVVLGRRHPQRPPAGQVGYIPQGLGLVRHATVLRNVLAGTLRQAGRIRGAVGLPAAAQTARAMTALERVGLAEKAHERPLRLSGGERRRVAVARAIAQRPRLLLADEMLSELDAHTAGSVLDAVRQLQAETGMGLLLVEHDVDTACQVADVLCCVAAGTVAVTLPPGGDRARLAREVVAGRAPAAD